MTDLRELAELLKSQDPNIRKQAIIQMANSQDPRALKALQWVYKNDPDPALQDLALRGAKFIKDKTTEQSAVSIADAVPSWDQPSASSVVVASNPMAAPAKSSRPRPTYDPTPSQFGEYGDGMENPTIEPDPISPKDERAARALLDRAIDYKIRGQMHKATENLIQAFTINPNLRHDMLATGLAADLLELPTEKAVAMLMDRVARENLTHAVKGAIQQQEKVENKKSTEDELYDGLFWGIIYFVLWFGITLGLVLLFVGFITNTALWDQAFSEAAKDPDLTDAERAELSVFEQTFRNFQDQVETVGTAVAVVLGLVVAINQIITLLLNAGVVHIVAKALMGKGTMWGFFARLIQYQLLWIGGSIAWVFGSFFVPYLLVGACVYVPLALYTYIRVIANFYKLGTGVSFVVAILSYFMFYVGNLMAWFLLDGMLGAL